MTSPPAPGSRPGTARTLARGVLLLGPPASGKDTVTEALVELDPRFAHFHPLKAGPGRTRGYRMTSAGELDALRARGEIVWTTHRYDAQYAIDAPGLAGMLDAGQIPVLHLGDPDAAAAITDRFLDVAWQIVLLTCPRDIALQRIRERATGDTDARTAAWDAFRPPPRVDQQLDTSALDPAAAAAAIRDQQPTARPR